MEVNNEITQLVTFKIGNEDFGSEVLTIKEIIKISPITKIPKTEPYVKGMINLRGSIVPVISLRLFLKMEEKEFDSQTRVIVINENEKLIGFVVDAVSEVIRIPVSEISNPDIIFRTSDQADFITGVYQNEQKIVTLMSFSKMKIIGYFGS